MKLSVGDRVSFTTVPLRKLVVLLLLLALGTALLMPGNYYRLGNLFFGAVPFLYHVDLAQRLYAHAAYPLLGSAPRYAHYQLSRTYFIQGQFQSALAETEQELTKYPDNYQTYYIIGLTYAYMSMETEAIAAFSKFIEVYPENTAARNDKAWLQFRIGDLEGALATIEPVSHVATPWVQNTYGVLLMNAGRYEEAAVALDQAALLVSGMVPADWGSGYPGNDPRIYTQGLASFAESITANQALLAELQQASSSPHTP